MKRTVSFLLLLALLASTACTASRAFRRGQDAQRVGDWDAAVEHFTKAVQENPDSPEYKIQLRRAQEEAARMHVERARDFESKDQLDSALMEYRRSLELIGTDRIARAKVAELERTIRERIEATRPKPAIDTLREQARAQGAPPLLNPASREPLRLNFGTATSLRDIINFIGTASGINVTYDAGYVDKPYSVTLDGVTVEEALQQVLSANQYYYKVTNSRTIIVIPDQPAKHQQYDDLVIKVFYVSHADATELVQLVNTIMRIPQMAIQPTIMPSKTANTITVRATGPVMDVIERVIEANDKPRAEVVLDVEVLEVNRNRVKRYGINLSAYALNLMFSPELAPPNTSATPGTFSPSPPLFNLNTISQGVSTSDFYLGVPTAVVNFLESDAHTKILAKPQLRGQEGNPLTLNLGADIPVLQTVFGAAAAGGFATIPQSSYTYRPTGVNLAITPRVTYAGEILLDVAIENSQVGPSVDVGGQSAPSFTSRKAHTWLRLREGEANLLAGLSLTTSTNNRQGVIGLMRLPGFRQLFSGNDIRDEDTEIVMLITPHIVRGHELTAEDVGSIYIGTQQNIGISGPPPLIAPLPDAGRGATPPPAGTTPGAGLIAPLPTLPQTQPQPGIPPTTPGAGAPGVQPVTPTVTPANPTPTAPPGGATPPAATGGAPPATPPRDVTQPAGVPGAANPQPTAAQIIITPAGTEFRVAGGPYAAPVSINNASRLSAITLTVTYNPTVLRVRTVQEGTFMRQNGVNASFTPRIDASNGRVDIAIARTNDQLGASGAGLLAALVFDAVAPGASSITVTGVANNPEGQPITLSFAPVTVTVR
jgi:general secretion pathway protein D